MPMLIIGGDEGPKKKKMRSMIGGEGYEDDAEDTEDGAIGGDMLDKKREAAKMLVAALGAPPSAVGKVEKALEAFVYACEDE